MSLASNLVETAAQRGASPAIQLDDLTLSYDDLLSQASAVARWLTDQGLKPGDRVGMVMPNVPAFPVYFYGVQLAGGAAVPMNPLLKAREIEFYLTDSGAQFLFTIDDFSAEAKAACDTVGATCVVAPITGTDLPPASFDAVPRDADDLAVVLYTSGTTGRPKGAQLTQSNMGSNAETVARQLFKLTPDDIVMGCLPLFHVFGLTCGLNASVYAGARLVLIPRFDGQVALDVIAKNQVTLFIGVPTMYSAMLHATDGTQKLASLRVCISGGAPLPVDVLRQFEETFDCKILEGYGLSETSPVACFNRLDIERKPGTIGVPIENVEMRLVNDDMQDVAPDEVGEIVIKGPNVMKGYWGLPEATAETVIDGWLRTGDLATRDDDSYYTIVDRKKSLILRGGYNVYPREIEEVIYEHAAVAEAAVIGIAHPDLGEEVAAAVSLKANVVADPEEIKQFIKERVAAYKYPRHVWILAELPKGPTGKILRREVKPPSEFGGA